MLISIETNPSKNIYEQIIEQITKKSVYFDRVYTQPLGWVRYIEENKCCNKFYLRISDPEIMDDNTAVFDFDLDQEDDPELADAEWIYCICRFDDSVKVFELQRNGGVNIRIHFINGQPEFTLNGHGDCDLRRSFIITNP